MGKFKVAVWPVLLTGANNDKVVIEHEQPLSGDSRVKVTSLEVTRLEALSLLNHLETALRPDHAEPWELAYEARIHELETQVDKLINSPFTLAGLSTDSPPSTDPTSGGPANSRPVSGTTAPVSSRFERFVDWFWSIGIKTQRKERN